MSVFSGIWVPLVTPFSQAVIDHAALRRLVRFYAEAGVAGVVALGTTGEAAALDDREQRAVLDTVLDAAGTLPVIAGLSGNHAGHLRESAHRITSGRLKPAYSIISRGSPISVANRWCCTIFRIGPAQHLNCLPC